MKRIITLLTIITIIFSNIQPVMAADSSSVVVEATAVYPEAPEINGHAAILIDIDTGAILYSKNADEKMYPASITKIMTAILTLENAQMDDVVTFSYDAVFTVEAGSSAAYVDVDEQLTVEQCLYGLMLISGNDLANGLAEHVGGTMTNFANMMTDKAEEIGCLNTNFTNAHGLHDDNHYTTAYD
ncbi:MAG: serine hydrolase, partial [Lachnospiraceae bacterium]|nr:serine hydrolase [Lachnospiraceae bacterium]